MATQGCPCGFLGHPRKPCRCTPHQIQQYRGRLSGPLLDRIDLHIEVPAVSARELMRGMGRRRRAVEVDSDDGIELAAAGDERAPANVRAFSRGGGADQPNESSANIRARVEAAREVQRRRFGGGCRTGGRESGGSTPIHCNAQMGIREIEEFCQIDDATRAFLQKAIESLSLSARAAHRSLRVARTIADLAGASELQLEHVAEAVQYQAVDRIRDT